MTTIKILPENLVNQIAAGEVVERPASVVKELLENSLDAGATAITVDIKDGGKTFIKVSDNGRGMSCGDCELALQRHATSKISAENDLWKIVTMGFRGEALASISSVSKLILKSRLREEMAGTKIESEGGEIRSKGETGMSTGTQVEVYNLFFNTPARQKYLKKESTELGHVTAILNIIALANPAVAFKLIHNEKTVFDLVPTTDLISRVSDIFGGSTAEAMLPIFYGSSIFQVDGFVGKPLLSRSTSQHQYIFVNGRPIQHYLLAHRIKAAFHSMLMENKKPVFILNIKIDPALIDVNVHPRKIEVRFEDQKTVLGVVYGCVKKALEKGNLMPKGFTEASRYISDGFPRTSVAGRLGGRAVDRGGGTIQNALRFSKEILREREIRPLSQPDCVDFRASMRSITQIANSYIVAENEEGLVLIDQHAAHERVRYEQLMDQFEKQKKSVQPLLVPRELELSSDEFSLIETNLSVFEKLGFEIEVFSVKSFVVQAVPAFLAQEDIDEVIKGVLDDINNKKKPSWLQGRKEQVITYMSCRSAIKFGQKLNQEEMQTLIEQMDKLKRPYTCPHGRPTMISLTLSELEKMFGRK